MGKWVASEVLDGALQILSGATHMVALAAQPSGYAAAVANKLAQAALGAVDFTLSDGVGAGRKVIVGAKPDVEVSGTGLATHVALLDSLNAKLLYVTTCPGQMLSSGTRVNFEPWAVEIGAPV